MKKSSSFFLLIVLIQISFFPAAFGQTSAITNGLNYLTAAQNSDGSWGSDSFSTEIFPATVAVMQTFQILNQTGSLNYSSGLSWLQSQSLDTTDYLSGRLLILSSSDTTDLNLLLTYTDIYTKAWGGYDQVQANNLDTALALQALRSANNSNQALISSAINYLIGSQNTDGGWGLYPPSCLGCTDGDSSSVYMTAIVLNALSRFMSLYDVQTPISKAATCLLAKQNPDGGFGSDSSTAYETALAFLALMQSGQGQVQSLLNAISYVITTQLSDGSWDEDPYSTALALQALANIKPNLVVSESDISLSELMPTVGQSDTITATVHNNGIQEALNVVVRFFNGDPAAGGIQIGTDQVIPSLAPGASVQVSVTNIFTATGIATIFVQIDPDNLIDEATKGDNIASTRIWVATSPDLAVYSGDLIASTYAPAFGVPFTLSYIVRNLGESATGAFVVSLYDGDPSQGGIFLQSANISGIAGTDIRTGTFGVTLTGNGMHTLYLVADSGNQITEQTKTNNTGTVTVNVGAVLSQADLVVTSGDVTLNPNRPHLGDVVQITVHIRNQGAQSADNFLAEIFDGAPETGGTLIYSQTLSLSPGADQMITANWAIPSGIHEVFVILDRPNQIPEDNENNNRASVRVMADMVDIVVTATDLTFTPPKPVVDDTVLLSITVHNTGIRDTGTFNVALYDGDPQAGGVLQQTFSVSNIAGDGSSTLSYTFTAVPWTYRFYAIADPENTVTELYEDNNTAIRSLKIKSPGETLGPDLVPVRVDLSDTTTNQQTLAISGTAHVTIQNTGDDKITTPFEVIIFEDEDGDGLYTPGVDNLLGTGTNNIALWPEGANTVNIALSGSVNFLHSPLYASVDSTDVIWEQDEGNNIMRSGADCENRPANPIQPVLKWKWLSGNSWHCYDQVITPPVIARIHDDNGDGKIDEKDDPYIIFLTPNDGTCEGGARSAIRALNGKTGQQLWMFYDPANHPVYSSGFLSAGDLDGDGLTEIIVPRYTTSSTPEGIIVLSNNGTLKWDNFQQAAAWNAAHFPSRTKIAGQSIPLLTDIDRNGQKEIVVGPTIVNPDGSIRSGWNYSSGTGRVSGCYNSVSAVADLDLDGKPKIIAGNTAYNADGSVRWWNRSVPDGEVAIGNFDDDPYPEIVLVTFYSAQLSVYLLDRNGAVRWGPVSITQLNGSDYPYVVHCTVPTIADFDGDGKPEIGIRGRRYFILDAEGHLKRTLPIEDPKISIFSHWSYTANANSATVFDLNGDGRPEVLSHTDDYFRILEGDNGTLLYQEAFGARPGTYQNVIVADVDGDGQADIVVFGGYGGGNLISPNRGLNVYGAKNHDWVGTRSVWNQPGYHVTNINDDNTIPQYESPSWLLNNTYHCQARTDQNPNPYLAANLTASYLRAEQNGASVDLAVRVGNGGAKEAPAGVTVTFYEGPPSAGVVIGTSSTGQILEPGDYEDVTFSWIGGTIGQHSIYAIVDPANAIPECNEGDNQAQLDFTTQVGYPDLKVGPEDIALPTTPYYEGAPIDISVSVRNIGSIDASNVIARLYLGSPTAGGVQIGQDQVIPSITTSGSSNLALTFDTLGRSGTNVLYVVIDPANTIVESDESNNIAAVTVQVSPPVLPDLSITSGDIQLVPPSPVEGDPVTILATIHNLGIAAANIPIQIYLGDPSAGGTLISEQVIAPILNTGQTAMAQASLDSIGLGGQNQVYVVIDPANTITESSKDNNAASKALIVQPAALTSSLILDKTSYQASETVTATIGVTDSSGQPRNLTLNLFVKDSAGNLISTIIDNGSVSIGSGGTASTNSTWNTGSNLSGSYIMTAEFSENGRVVSRANASFSILPDQRLGVLVRTGKTQYNIKEDALITATVTSLSQNYIYENLIARITISNSQGTALFTDQRSVVLLTPGRLTELKYYWNTDTNPSGTYPVTVDVMNASGAVVATGSANITISSDIKPSLFLRGQISVDKQSILQGEPVNISYSVTNVGNMDLSDILLFVRTVHVVELTAYDTLTDQTGLVIGQTYTNTKQLDTQNYTAKDYLVILSASISGVEETLDGTYFRVEGAPSVPSISSPSDGVDVDTYTPSLTVNNASDPNDDRLTYEFELYSDIGLSNLLTTSGTITEGTGTTSWQVPLQLQENARYYWRARAYDGWLYGDWMVPASFRVNLVDDPPTAPTRSSPADSSQVSTLTPILTVNNASDPDSANLTYNYELALDSSFTQTVTLATGIFEGTGTTSWQVPLSLDENTWYYWRAQADDWFTTGPWMTTARFFVNTVNDAPSAPTIISPVNDSEITAYYTDIAIANSTDPDSIQLTYLFEVDTVMTFDSPGIVRSGNVPEGQGGTTTWPITGLKEDTYYYVRAKASDGSAESPWSSAIGFFVNTQNEPPTTPLPANPSDGGAVNVAAPTLSIYNASDPDRDELTYEFEIYEDVAMTTLVNSVSGISETPDITSWTVPVILTENKIYFWRARAFDGELHGDWMPLAFFMVNTANDAPAAPSLHSPADGSSLDTLTPTLSVYNAVDPDSDFLTYDFEIYSQGLLVQSITAVPQDVSGITSAIISPLLDNTTYTWRARAYDGDRYGAWMDTASFSIHLPVTNITATIDFDPNTLNKKSNGNWVVVYIELPTGYSVNDIAISSIRLEGTIPAEHWPYAIGDYDNDGIPDLMVKFSRNAVINLLPNGDNITVHVTGSVGSTTFEGVDTIRVIH